MPIGEDSSMILSQRVRDFREEWSGEIMLSLSVVLRSGLNLQSHFPSSSVQI